MLTLNCYGVATPTTRSRLRALARELNARDDAIVCLQEVHSHAYRKLLMNDSPNYPHAAYAPFIHALKGGLLTLSRLPIEEWQFALYRDREIPYLPSVLDWLLHKGVLVTRITYAGVPIVVLNTHLHANYSANWDRQHRYTRGVLGQLRQLAELVRAQPPEAIVIAAGDFNVPRGSWLYEEFLAESGMIDPLKGDTRPTVRAPQRFAARYAQPIDFAFVRAPRLPGFETASDLRFADRVPLLAGKPRFLSDHLGVELRVRWDEERS